MMSTFSCFCCFSNFIDLRKLVKSSGDKCDIKSRRERHVTFQRLTRSPGKLLAHLCALIFHL